MDSASLSAASGLRAWRWILPNDHQYQSVFPPIDRYGNDSAVSLRADVACFIRRWCERAGPPWTEAFGSERLTGSLLDCLTHRVHILEMDGDSYRRLGSRQSAAALAPASDRPTAD